MATRLPALPPSRGRSVLEFEAYRVERTTTEKLPDLLNDLTMNNAFVENGDVDEEHPWQYDHVIQVTYVGGRDWVVLVGEEVAVPRDGTVRQT